MMTGRCLCGAVMFEAAGVETKHHVCLCDMCRRWAGGPGLMVADTTSVTFTGEQPATFESSDWASRGFCKTCGTTLFYFRKPTQTYMMCVGAFDDQAAFELVLEIFSDHKPPGFAFAGAHPRWTRAETFKQFGIE